MKELLALLLGIVNPSDNGDGESRVNQVSKVLGTAAIVLGALLSLVNEILGALGGG